MDKKEIYKQLFEKYNLQKSDAITFINHRIGVAIDKEKMLESISNNVDKLMILCGDLKLEIRLHEINPLLTINAQQFYTTKQASEILNVSPGKIRELINNGILITKKINQRNWKIPHWSLDAYKSDLCNFLTSCEDSLSTFDVLDITDVENEILLTLLSKSSIQKVHEYETRLSRKITTIITQL